MWNANCLVQDLNSGCWFHFLWWCSKFRKYSVNNYHKNHHHLVVPSAQISPTLFCHPSLSSITSGRSSGLHPVFSQSCCSSRPSCFCTAMWRGPLEYITYELVPTSPAVSCMSGLSKQQLYGHYKNTLVKLSEIFRKKLECKKCYH